MKIGMCLFLWATRVGPEHEALLADIRATGFDGVEVPVFEAVPSDYARLGSVLDGLGLARTAVSAMGDPAAGPLAAPGRYALELDLGTVKSRLARGRTALRDHLVIAMPELGGRP